MNKFTSEYLLIYNLEFCYLIATEPACDYPETMGDDYGDDDMPDMGEVSIHVAVMGLSSSSLHCPLL